MRSILGLVFTGAVAVGLNPVQAPPSFIVSDVRVFDGERVAEHRSVLVQDGRIARVGGSTFAVPAGTAVMDGRGRTLLPGLIDAHVHLSDDPEADLRQSGVGSSRPIGARVYRRQKRRPPLPCSPGSGAT